MMNRILLGASALVVLTGCTDMGGLFQQRERQAEAPAEAPVDDTAPLDTVAPADPPPANAASEEDFDTTTAEDREKAAAVPEPGGEQLLGTTVASLGDPTRSGFWLETPLVDVVTQGRVEFPESGKSAQVELIPIDGPATAGSRISLPAMRLIEAPLTDLATIRVFRN
ncbi:lipoprotein [Marinovum sp.]|uniref:lipoprotein n=1 Tax=Marinovum sp. TaxID=2024839 RepID=UPI003A8FBAA2